MWETFCWQLRILVSFYADGIGFSILIYVGMD